MKTPKKIKLLILCMIVVFTSISLKSYSQQYNLNNSNSELKVFGTSNLHDWHIDAEKQRGYIIMEGADNNIIIKKFKIYAVSESLKSGKNGMDKNTYKALNTEEHKIITFEITETKSISKIADNTYQVEVKGDLSIAGVTKNILLSFSLKLSNKEAHLTGEKSIKMTDFKIEPPTALFGTITTGDEVTIKFNTILKQ